MARLFMKNEGLANYKEKSTITSATPIHCVSQQSVTATAILKLVGAKKLYLDKR
jgi:hypothetical protein